MLIKTRYYYSLYRKKTSSIPAKFSQFLIPEKVTTLDIILHFKHILLLQCICLVLHLHCLIITFVDCCYPSTTFIIK